MNTVRLMLLLIGMLTALLVGGSALAVSGDDSENDEYELILKPEILNFAQMKKKRVIRVLVSYNNSNYFVSNGRQYGLEFELMRKFENSLNQKLKKSDEEIHITYISVPFDKLIPYLVGGYGDIAAAGMTITPAREAVITFSEPYRSNVREVLARAPKSEPVSSLLDLSGKTLHVVAGSSYIDHLQQLNRQFQIQGRAPVELVEVGGSLELEDILEMVNAGVFSYTVVDDHVGDLWAGVLPDLIIEDQVVLHQGGAIAWAVRKDNPELEAALNRFIYKNKQGTLTGNMLFKRYYKNNKWIKNPLTEKRQKQLDDYIGLFKKYGKQYDFDWVLLGALAFQESGLQQNKKSRAGAVGIMQIKPSTAADKNVGIKNITKNTENNIHAGTKYLAFLRDRYFSTQELTQEERYNFTIAAYNAGPGNIRKFRREAEKVGLDPNKWFYNVEHIARKRLGRETVQYVAHVNKYYVAYKSVLDHDTRKKKLKQSIKEQN